MLLFLSTYTNKIDKKGRVSVPAPFRAELERGHSNGFIVFPNPEQPCIDAWDRDRLARYARDRDTFDPDSPEFATVTNVMLTSKPMSFDSEGRVTLPPDLLEDCNINGEVVFAGLGETFQIWSPGNFADYSADAAQRIKDSPHRIRISPSTSSAFDGDHNG